jgi:hypothetical protein
MVALICDIRGIFNSSSFSWKRNDSLCQNLFHEQHGRNVMASFHFKISDGREGETSIEAANAHEAVNEGLNALAMFACRRFPPPDNVSITVSDEDRRQVATLKFRFEIDYAAGVAM